MAVKGVKFNPNRVRLEERIPLGTPFRVFFYVSSFCNFHCSFCPHGHSQAVKQKPQALMPLSLAQKCLNDLMAFPDKIKLLTFAGVGEPLLNKNLPEIIQTAVEYEVAEKYEITTNASLLTDQLSEKLIRAGISLIQISIYGLNDLQYKEFSNASLKFDDLVRNIEYLYAIKGQAEMIIKITDAVCGTEAGQDEFHRIFSPICDRICLEHAAPIWYEMPMNDESGLDIYGHPIVRKEVCPLPFFNLIVNEDGVVTPCCADWKHKLVMGHADREALKSIWEGQEYRKLWQALLSGRPASPYPCRDCAYPELTTIDNIDDFREELLQKIKGR